MKYEGRKIKIGFGRPFDLPDGAIVGSFDGAILKYIIPVEDIDQKNTDLETFDGSVDSEQADVEDVEDVVAVEKPTVNKVVKKTTKKTGKNRR